MKPVSFNSEYPRRLKAAVIGCGGHAMRNVFPTFHYSPIDFVAACDLHEDLARSAANTFGARSIYSDYRLMLAQEEPEVVFVVLNYDERGHARYPAIAVDIMRSGAHVWIEKPPASSSEEIRQMKAVSQETGKFVGVGFKKMFAPANRKAKEIIGRPEFGSISTITGRYPQPIPSAENRANDLLMVSFLDHVVHPYSVLRYLGGPIKTLRFESEPSTGGSMTTIRFVNGALGNLHLAAGQSGQSPLERTEIVGKGANVVIENNIRLTYYRASQGSGIYGRTASYFEDDESAPLFWEPEFSLGQLYNKGLFLLGYAPEIVDFCECALINIAPQYGNLDDALELLKVYEAYRQPEGQTIAICE